MSDAPVTLLPWQEDSATELWSSVVKHGVAADGSDTGTGKTIKALIVAKELGRPVIVVTLKSVRPDWELWAERIGVQVTVVNYEKVRGGKTPLGKWTVIGTKTKTSTDGTKTKKKVPKVFEWTVGNAILVFDEAHVLGGMDTQQSRLLIAATRQKIPRLLLSATLLENPLKGKAIGHALGLHHITNFWDWAKKHGVKEGFFGMEWKPKHAAAVMAAIRAEMGDRFTRIRKADVPDFPDNQVIPVYAETDDMPDLESNYGMAAREAVELLKVDALAERAETLVEQGMSVAIFVNFLATLSALHERFPNAGLICGGQSNVTRSTAINSFQQNENHVLLVMAQAGGTGLSLHDLHGRPRASIVSPGWSATQFLQVLGRIHRAGALSPALTYVLFARGVSIERRMRSRLEAKLNNLSALNDSDFYNPHNDAIAATHHQSAQSSGGLPANPGASPNSVTGLSDEHHVDQGGHHTGAAGAPGHSGPDHHGSGIFGDDGDADGHVGDPTDIFLGAGQVVKHDPVVCGEGTDNSFQQPQENGGSQVSTQTVPAGWAEVTTVSDVNGDVVGIVTGLPSNPVNVQNLAKALEAVGDHGVRKHARCSPSKLKNLEICPSYEPDEDGVVHPITLRGTAMHEAMETGNDTGIDADELALVTMCREILEPEAQWAEKVIAEPHIKTHDKDVSGFVDLLMIGPKQADGTRKALIRDYKFGFNLVDHPSINPQAIAYTVGTFIAHPDISEINFAFLIPRCDAVLEHNFYRSNLPELQLRLSTIATRVRQLAGKEFNPHNENCLYCGRKATCEALHAKALPLAKGYNEDEALPLPDEFHSSQITDPQQMAYALNLAAVLEKWVESVRSHALKFRLELGQEIPGYDLIERNPPRTVLNPTKAFELAQARGVTLEEFLSACKVSIGSLEKAVGEHAEKGQKGKVVEAFGDELSDQMVVSQGNAFHVLQRSKKKGAKTALPAAT